MNIRKMVDQIDVIASGILLFCSYMSYRGAESCRKANERMKKFGKEVEEESNRCNKLNIPFNIGDIARKYNIPVISASFEAPGNYESEKTIIKEDGTLEEYVSNGNKWVRYK